MGVGVRVKVGVGVWVECLLVGIRVRARVKFRDQMRVTRKRGLAVKIRGQNLVYCEINQILIRSS